MKKIIVLFLMFFTFNSIVSGQNFADKNLLRHVVMFGWKSGADSSDINKVVEAFRLLPGKISLIKHFEWGTNNSPEKLNQGLSHCFLLSFASEKDRDEYIVHPAHQLFVNLPKPGLDKVTVLDYWMRE